MKKIIIFFKKAASFLYKKWVNILEVIVAVVTIWGMFIASYLFDRIHCSDWCLMARIESNMEGIPILRPIYFEYSIIFFLSGILILYLLRRYHKK
jgi:uncharacterized membrane protein